MPASKQKGKNGRGKVPVTKRLKLLVGERQDGETDKAVTACNIYLRLPVRSLAKVAKRLMRLDPTKYNNFNGTHSTVKGWSTKYGWVDRASAYDVERERYKTARANAIMNQGIAQTHERVRQLQRINGLLMRQLEQGALYLESKKSLKDGDTNVIISELKYNQALIRDILQTLDDTAKETGGRVSNVNMNITGLAGLLSSAPNFGEVEIEDAQVIDDVDEQDAQDTD